METKRHFPGEYGYKDIIKFKRKGKIVEGMIVVLQYLVMTLKMNMLCIKYIHLRVLRIDFIFMT